MADRTLLIPGTQATNLLNQDGGRVYNVVRVNLGLVKKDLGKDPAVWVKILSMEHAPGQLAPVRTSLQPGTEARLTAIRGGPRRCSRYPRRWTGPTAAPLPPRRAVSCPERR